MTEKKAWRHVVGAGISIFVILLLAGCSSSSSNNPPAATQTFGSTSALGHSHSVVMNKADIDTPPAAGIALVTSSVSNHSHSFAMTADQLRAVANGSTVSVVTGSADGGAGAHTHSFSIAKWF